MENTKTVRPRGTDSAKVIQVIVTEAVKGLGTDEDLCRIVTQYWDFDGSLLAEDDPCITESVEQGIGFTYAELTRLNTMIGAALAFGKVEFDEISESVYRKIAEEICKQNDKEGT
ncbi:MAG: hypothetical protein Q4F83_10910 [Eubacteriales bacterium]|nr:hypothetical protein [Eubacteriales bacterium]